MKYGILCLIHVNRGVSLLFFLNREEDLQLELFVYSLCEQERPAPGATNFIIFGWGLFAYNHDNDPNTQ